MRSKKSIAVIVSSLFIFMMLISCGNKDDKSNQKKANASVNQSKSQSSEKNKTNIAVKRGSNGQEITVDLFQFTIPKDWKGDEDTQVWFPNTEDDNIPLPPHSFQHGARPLMGIASLEKGIENHIGVVPNKKNPVTIGDMQGFICEWQRENYKNIGLFLLEKNAGMDIMYFFICQAPASSFEQYKKTYKEILSSISIK